MTMPRMLLLLLSAVIACGDADSPFAPPPAETSTGSSMVPEETDQPDSVGLVSPTVNASTTTSTPTVQPVEFDLDAWLSGAFAFAAPLTSTATSGAFDPDLLGDLTVDICPAAACGQQSLATYTSQTGSGSETIRLDSDDEHFVVNWHTDDFDLSAGPYFLIRVLAAGLEVGWIEVQIVNNGSQLKDANTGSSIGLLDGRTLPVKFTITTNPLIRAWVGAANGGGSVEVARSLAADFSLDPGSVAELLAIAGFDAIEVATALADQGLEAPAIARLLLDNGLVTGPDGMAVALVAVGAAATEVAEVLRDQFSLTAGQTATALYSAGVSAAEAGTAIRAAFQLDLPGTIQALKDGLFPGGEVGTWALSEPETPSVETVTGLLATARFPIDEVGTWSSDNLLDLALTLQIMDPNYGQTEAAEWLWGHLAGAVDETAAVMRDAGRSAGEVVDFLMNSKNQVFDVVAAAVQKIGYTALEAAGAFRQYAGTNVHAIADKLGTLWGLGTSKIAGTVRNAGYAARDVADWALTTSAGTVHDAMQLLKDAGYGVGEAVTGLVEGTQAALEDVGQGAVDIFNATTQDWAEPMKQVLEGLKSQSEVARDLHAAAMGVIRNLSPGISDEDAAGQSVADLSSLGFDPMDVGDWTADTLTDLALTLQIMDPNYGQTEAFDWLWSRVGGVASDAAAAMADAQYSATEVVKYVIGQKNQVVDTVIAMLNAVGYSATASASAMWLEGGASSTQLAVGLSQYWGSTPLEIVQIFQGLAMSLTDIVTALLNGLLLTATEVTTLLVQAGFALADIIAVLP